MNWTVKKGLHQHVLLDDSQKPTVYIRYRHGDALLTDLAAAPLLEVRAVSPLLLEIHGAHEGTAKISLEAAPSILQAPRAQELQLSWEGKSFRLEQSPGRSFTIFSQAQEIGSITEILHLTVSVSTASDEPELAALFYVLALRMLHADDLELV